MWTLKNGINVILKVKCLLFASYIPDARIWDFFIADVTSLLEFLVNRLDVFVEVGDGESLATIWTLGALVVVHLPDVPGQVRHSKLLLTMRTGLLNLEITNM